MSKIIYPLGILLTIVIGAYLQYIFCCPAKENMVEEEPQRVVETVPDKVTNPMVIVDPEGSFDYKAKEDNLNFKISGSVIITPVSTEVDTGMLKLVAYLNDNPSKSIDITGYYLASENYSGALPNLGVARATAVKNYLVSLGVNSRQINTVGKLHDEIITTNGILLGPVKIKVFTTDEEEMAAADEKLEAMAADIRKNPLVLYFNTNESQINLTAAQRQKIANISRYLDKVPNAVCWVVGHTDSRGKLSKNMELGQERADFAKQYLIKNGIAAGKIEATSMGPKNPIASNNTKAGQAKNRRTVITLK